MLFHELFLAGAVSGEPQGARAWWGPGHPKPERRGLEGKSAAIASSLPLVPRAPHASAHGPRGGDGSTVIPSPASAPPQAEAAGKSPAEPGAAARVAQRPRRSTAPITGAEHPKRCSKRRKRWGRNGSGTPGEESQGQGGKGKRRPPPGPKAMLEAPSHHGLNLPRPGGV